MDLREIKKLITLMNENGLSRLEAEEEGKRILLEKEGASPAGANPTLVMHSGGMPQMPAMAPAPHPAMAPSFGGDAAPAPAAGAASPKPPAAPEDTVTFNSPMVGTFYTAASPDAEAFVRPGDKVTKDTVVCLIEAMKMFNEIKAEITGTVVERLAESGEAIEYNQPLFLIRPS